MKTYVISRSVLLRMRNVLDKCQIKGTHSIFNNIFLENKAVYEIMWKIL
jgi:hypothetical protein